MNLAFSIVNPFRLKHMLDMCGDRDSLPPSAGWTFSFWSFLDISLY